MRDRERTDHCLEARVKSHEERWLVREGEHPLLHHRALDVVVLDDDVLLEDLDGVQLVRAFALGQQNLKIRENMCVAGGEIEFQVGGKYILCFISFVFLVKNY